MPRLLVNEISREMVTGLLEGRDGPVELAASIDGISLDHIDTSAAGNFTVALASSEPLIGQTLAIWLADDPTVHVVVPLHLGSGDAHSLEDEIKLLRAELELVKTALRRALGPQGQG